MNFNEYYTETTKTAVYDNKTTQSELTYLTLGLAGETGEFVDMVKKCHRDMHVKGTPFDWEVGNRFEPMILELGDIAWYWIRACRALGVTPEYVLQRNVDKLRERYAEKHAPSNN